MTNNTSILITGSSGLIGSEVVEFFAGQGRVVHGVDNNQREKFFGLQGSTRWNQNRLLKQYSTFSHHELDIRNCTEILALISALRPSEIVHTAAQPSYDRASSDSI